VNLGVRWDPYFAYTDARIGSPAIAPDRISRYPNAPRGSYTQVTPVVLRLERMVRSPTSPHALDLPTSRSKHRASGGAGIYYTLPNTDQVNGFTSVAPFAPVFTLTGVNFQDPWEAPALPTRSRGVWRRCGSRSGRNFTLPSVIAGVFPAHYYLPTVATWNMTLQRQLGTNWLFSAGYVGNAGYHLSSNAVGRQQLNPAVYVPGHLQLQIPSPGA